MLDYALVKKETDQYYETEMKSYSDDIPEEIEKARFYELVVNLLNQEVLDYHYTFKESDFDFIIKYHIALPKLLKHFEKLIPEKGNE